MSEPLTEQEKHELLNSVGYTPDVDEPQIAFDEMAQSTPGEIQVVAETLNRPLPIRRTRRKKAPEPEDVATATSPLYDNSWQDAEFQERKAIVGKGFDADEASEHNKKLWAALGKERMTHNAAVRAAQRALSGTGKLKDVITAHRDHRESVEDLTKFLADVPEDELQEALKRLA